MIASKMFRPILAAALIGGVAIPATGVAHARTAKTVKRALLTPIAKSKANRLILQGARLLVSKGCKGRVSTKVTRTRKGGRVVAYQCKKDGTTVFVRFVNFGAGSWFPTKIDLAG